MVESSAAPGTRRRVARGIAAVAFIVAGVNHFVMPGVYERMMPPALPHPALLVVVSGVAEVAGGAGLVIPRLRRAAAWGLIALLLAVFPANLFMAINPAEAGAGGIPPWLLWLRLPLQPLLIAFVAYAGLGRR